MTAVRGERVQAPFGVRALRLTRREEYGAYVVLSGGDPDGPRPDPGQFYMLRSSERWGGGAGERPFLPRAFSVLRTGGDGEGLELQFLLEAVGPGTERLCELDAGEELSVLGPLGRGFAAPRPGHRVLLVGGGVGIAPLAIWQDRLDTGTTVLLGFRDAHHAAGAALLSGAVVATDDGSVGDHGLVTDLLESELDAGGEAEVYACGPPPMLEVVRAVCAERSVPAQLALEAGMACGFGGCFGCVVPSARGLIRLCLEGPVLDGAECSSETFAVAGMGHSG
ncbi:MAG: dihydroorotate dehydrogenase electron transfer subunit [Solirubrobacteraceae bacterium]